MCLLSCHILIPNPINILKSFETIHRNSEHSLFEYQFPLFTSLKLRFHTLITKYSHSMRGMCSRQKFKASAQKAKLKRGNIIQSGKTRRGKKIPKVYDPLLDGSLLGVDRMPLIILAFLRAPFLPTFPWPSLNLRYFITISATIPVLLFTSHVSSIHHILPPRTKKNAFGLP